MFSKFTASIAIIALGLTGTAFAFDLSSVKTKVLLGLEGPAGPRGIKNKVIGVTPLAEEGIDSLAGRNLRARYWSIRQEGIVPVHGHTLRPATIFTLQGDIFEYRNDQEEPILHNAGGLSLEEGHNLAHWWINEGDEDVRLIAFDVVIDGNILDESVKVSPVPSAPTEFELPKEKGVERKMVGFVDLEKHFQGEYGEGLALTHYRVSIAPGGKLPLWTEAGQPSIVFVERGRVTEHRSDKEEPTDIAVESGSVLGGGVLAWWKNDGFIPVELHIGAVEPIAVTEGVKNPSHAK